MKTEYVVLGVVALAGAGVGLYFLLRPAKEAPPPMMPPPQVSAAGKSLASRKGAKLMSAGKAALPMVMEIAKGFFASKGGGAAGMGGPFENIESVF